MSNRNMLLLVVGVIALVAIAAGASAYVTRDVMTPDKQVVETENTVKKEQVVWNEPKPAPQPQPQQVAKRCDDGNIVGAGIGAAAGGVIGNQFGKGKGKDLATIGGIIAGGTAGHQMIPTRGVLCR